ncbi:hypothetical protein WDZ17_05400 [Pseudokineococcus basanitobsidens]|uniref:Uncharacterized protein n=1 Tax=Pseudokineococcus basanitobsidens TaxID=1926649 RepID=A0ABU8RI32_9ACTN
MPAAADAVVRRKGARRAGPPRDAGAVQPAMTSVGARRGAIGGGLLAGALPASALISVDGGLSVAMAFLNVITLGVAAVGALLGAVCGALAGHLVDEGRTWVQAAVASGTTAAVLVLVSCWLATGFELSWSFLLPATPLVLGSAAVATWQSWSLARRQDHRSSVVGRRVGRPASSHDLDERAPRRGRPGPRWSADDGWRPRRSGPAEGRRP